MQLFINNYALGGKTVVLDCDPNDTIAKLKQRIQYKVKIPAKRQRLIFVGNILQNYHHFGDYNIQKESVIQLLAAKNYALEKVTVETITGVTTEIHISFFDTVFDLKTCIRKNNWISMRRQHLEWNDTELNDDNKCLYDYNIPANAIIKLVVGTLKNGSIQLQDSTDNKPLQVSIDDSVGMQDLKLLVEKKYGIPVSEQLYGKKKEKHTLIPTTLALAFCESYKRKIEMRFIEVVMKRGNDLHHLFDEEMKTIDKRFVEAKNQINMVSSLKMLRDIKSKKVEKSFEFTGHKLLNIFKCETEKIKNDLVKYECQLNRRMAEIISESDDLCTIDYNKLELRMEGICNIILNKKIDKLDKKVAEINNIYIKDIGKSLEYQELWAETMDKKIEKCEESFDKWDINIVIEWILIIENGYFDCQKYESFIEKLKEMGVKGIELKEIDSTFLLNILGLTIEKDQFILKRNIKRIIKHKHEISDESMCGICIENKIQTVIIPCGHAYMCYQCARKYSARKNKCPICRKRINNIQRIYVRGFSK